MTYPATNLNEAVGLIVPDSNALHDIINGDADSTIVTPKGREVPTVLKAMADSLLLKDPIPWEEGALEQDPLQLRTFTDGLIYWAPTAQAANPVAMGASPIGDSNWKISPIIKTHNSLRDRDEQGAHPASAIEGVVEVFSTVADMRSAMWLQAGRLLETKGYYLAGDGGHARYLIQTSAEFGDTPDEYGNHSLANGLVAVLQIGGVFKAKQFGASQDNTDAQNKAVIQHMINLLDGIAGNIYIEPDISYGWVRLDKSTWPDFSNLSSNPATRIIIDDYSFGQTRDPETPPNRSGAQHRKWYYTGNQNDLMHNGNFEYIKAAWHPGHFISHDGDIAEMAADAGANRRASTFYSTNGRANWRVGQGRVTDNLASEEELTQFLIAGNGFPDIGVEGLATSFTINKTNGSMGFNIGLPRYPFDVKSRIGQPSSNVFGFETPEGECRLRLAGETGVTWIITKANGGFSFADSLSPLYDVMQNGSQHTFRRNSEGDVRLRLQSFSTQRTISVNNSNSEFRITNAEGVSNTLRHTNEGNLLIAGSYSPFTGTHLFFCAEKLEEGQAVELVNGTPIDYVEYIEREPKCIERIEHIESFKPPRLDHESDEEYNERCKPSRDKVVVEVVEREPIETITKLNGEVALCNTPESKICAGVVERQVEMEGGYLTYVAAVGDNKTANLKGFRVSGSVKAGDILCTDIGGKLKLAPDNVSRSVVIFKALSDVDTEGRCYGYFIG